MLGVIWVVSFVGSVCYADDLSLLAPSLRIMPNIPTHAQSGGNRFSVCQSVVKKILKSVLCAQYTALKNIGIRLPFLGAGFVHMALSREC